MTLKAVCQDGNWEDYYWAKYVNLFFGWYDGETKVSDDTIYTYKAGKEDKAFVGKFVRISFPNTSDLLQMVRNDSKSITVRVEMLPMILDCLLVGMRMINVFPRKKS